VVSDFLSTIAMIIRIHRLRSQVGLRQRSSDQGFVAIGIEVGGQTICRDLMAPLSSAARAPFPVQAQSRQERTPTQFVCD
jgi:hypothetical protein